MYKHILLAADGSEQSYRAAEHAAKIAGSSPGCLLTMLYIINDQDAKKAVLQEETVKLAQQARAEKLHRHEALFYKKKVRYTVLIKNGEPASVIIKYAKNKQAELVLIGSRGLNQWQRFVLGSVSHKVLKHVKCPVIVVK